MKKITKNFLEKKFGSKKGEQLYDTGYCHYCYSSPGNWINNTLWYFFDKKKNRVLYFRTKWAGDNTTRDNFFKNGETKSKRDHGVEHFNF